jgi:hypothetical protein
VARRRASGEGGEQGLLKCLLGGVEAAEHAHQRAHDPGFLAADDVVEGATKLRHNSRISTAPSFTNAVPDAQCTASSRLSMRRKNSPPMTSLLSRNGPSNTVR